MTNPEVTTFHHCIHHWWPTLKSLHSTTVSITDDQSWSHYTPSLYPSLRTLPTSTENPAWSITCKCKCDKHEDMSASGINCDQLTNHHCIHHWWPILKSLHTTTVSITDDQPWSHYTPSLYPSLMTNPEVTTLHHCIHHWGHFLHPLRTRPEALLVSASVINMKIWVQVG